MGSKLMCDEYFSVEVIGLFQLDTTYESELRSRGLEAQVVPWIKEKYAVHTLLLQTLRRILRIFWLEMLSCFIL